jgi:hypothetical protein
VVTADLHVVRTEYKTPAPLWCSASTWAGRKGPPLSNFFASPTSSPETSCSRMRWDFFVTGLRRRIDMPPGTPC